MTKTKKKGGRAANGVVTVLNLSNLSEIARRAGVSPATAYRVMKYRDRKPSWELACRIADTMGWSLDQLRNHLEKAA